MEVKAISHSYWRQIKAGARTFEGVAGSSKAAVGDRAPEIRFLAQSDVAGGIITPEEYAEYIGETYPAAFGGTMEAPAGQ